MDKNQDCNITIENKRFRYRAAAIIIENDCVLLASNENNDYYYSVGGGVHIGETSEDAIIREVYEETGIKYEIDRLAFIHENFFVENNVEWHEIAFYFLMKSKGNQALDGNSYTNGVREFMNWIPICELKYLKAYPTFFVEKLTDLSDQVEHIVTIQEE